MLKKTIKYKDFNDEEVEEEFFFHLSKAELVELEMSHEGGLSDALQKIVAEKDAKRIIEEFKKIILQAYGKKSDDGRRFIKNEQLREEFVSTEAYSELFMELVTDTDAAIEFINGIIPSGLADEAAKVVNTDDRALAVAPEPSAEVPTITRKELHEMDRGAFLSANARIASGELNLAE